MIGDVTPVLVAAQAAALGSADVTRRWALSFADGTVRFAGVTRIEGHAASGALGGLRPEEWDDALIAVVLPVLLSDGAGPHLLDGQGRLVLAVAGHPCGDGARVALASVDPADIGGTTALGVVDEIDSPVWAWRVRGTVSAEQRIAALDDLDAARSAAEFRVWQRRWE